MHGDIGERKRMIRITLIGIAVAVALAMLWTLVSCQGRDSNASTAAALPTPTTNPSDLLVEEIVAAPKDCVSYDAADLVVEDRGASGWALVEEGEPGLLLFDTKSDANKGLAVARNYTKQCFIGRGNDRPDRYAYLTEYWTDPSGLPVGMAPALECESYEPETVEFLDAGGNGWQLMTSGGTLPLWFDTLRQAARGREVAVQHTQLCFIGLGNGRANPYKYLHESWRG